RAAGVMQRVFFLVGNVGARIAANLCAPGRDYMCDSRCAEAEIRDYADNDARPQHGSVRSLSSRVVLVGQKQRGSVAKKSRVFRERARQRSAIRAGLDRNCEVLAMAGRWLCRTARSLFKGARGCCECDQQ